MNSLLDDYSEAKAKAKLCLLDISFQQPRLFHPFLYKCPSPISLHQYFWVQFLSNYLHVLVMVFSDMHFLTFLTSKLQVHNVCPSV